MRRLMSVLRVCLGIAVGVAALLLVLMIPTFRDLSARKQEAKHDAAMLDEQLAIVRIDRVEFVSWDHQTTNTITGTEAQKILVSLAATNRTSGHELKDLERHVYFMSGSKKVLDFVLDDSGLWHFGAYRFCLRSR